MTAAQVQAFKGFIVSLGGRSEFRVKKIRFAAEDVTEVISHEHDVLQCLDVVLGAMNFRLNRKDLEKPAGAKRRSAKTLAKEKIYKRINERIRQTYPHFNIGMTTGTHGDLTNRWNHRYRHWNFRTTQRWRKAGPHRPLANGAPK